MYTMSRMNYILITLLGIPMLGVGCASVNSDSLDEAVTSSDTIEGSVQNGNLDEDARGIPQDRLFSTDELADSSLHFSFSATIPIAWQVEYVPESEAINFYDPADSNDTTLNQSQVFVKYFQASQFLTLSTVTIHNREDITIADRPAVRYDIQKLSSVADFPAQPYWRNQRHFVTDIRSTDASPTTFYVFGQNPAVDDETMSNFLESIKF